MLDVSGGKTFVGAVGQGGNAVWEPTSEREWSLISSSQIQEQRQLSLVVLFE